MFTTSVYDNTTQSQIGCPLVTTEEKNAYFTGTSSTDGGQTENRWVDYDCAPRAASMESFYKQLALKQSED